MIDANKTLKDFLSDNKRYRRSQFPLLPSVGDNGTTGANLPNLGPAAAEGGHVSRPRKKTQMSSKTPEGEKRLKNLNIQAKALANIENAKMKKMMKDLKRVRETRPQAVAPSRLTQRPPISKSPYAASHSRNYSETRSKQPCDITEAISLFKEIRGEIGVSPDMSKPTVDRRALSDYKYHFKNLVNEKSKRALSLQAPFRQPERARARNMSCDYTSHAKPKYLPPLADMKSEYERYSRSTSKVKAKKAEVAKNEGEKMQKKKKRLLVRHTKKTSQIQANMKEKKYMQHDEKLKAASARSKVLSRAEKNSPRSGTQKNAAQEVRSSPRPLKPRVATGSIASANSVAAVKGTAKNVSAKSCKKQASGHDVTSSQGKTALSERKSKRQDKPATPVKSPQKEEVSSSRSEKGSASPTVHSRNVRSPTVSRASSASADSYDGDSFYSDKGSVKSARSAKNVGNVKSTPSAKGLASQTRRVPSARSATKRASKTTDRATPLANKVARSKSGASHASKASSARSSSSSSERSARSIKESPKVASPEKSPQSSDRSASRDGEKSSPAQYETTNVGRSSASRSATVTSKRASSSTPVSEADRPGSAVPATRSLKSATKSVKSGNDIQPKDYSRSPTPHDLPEIKVPRSRAASRTSQATTGSGNSCGSRDSSRSPVMSARGKVKSARSNASARRQSSKSPSPKRSDRAKNKTLQSGSSKACDISQPGSARSLKCKDRCGSSSSTSSARTESIVQIPSESARSSKKCSAASARRSARSPSPVSERRSREPVMSQVKIGMKGKVSAKSRAPSSGYGDKIEPLPSSARSVRSQVSLKARSEVPEESQLSSARSETDSLRNKLPSSRNVSSARSSRASVEGRDSPGSGRSTPKSKPPSTWSEKQFSEANTRASSRSSVKEANSSKSFTSAGMPSARSLAPSACSSRSTKSRKQSVNSAMKPNGKEIHAAEGKSSSSRKDGASSARSDAKSLKSKTRSAMSAASSAGSENSAASTPRSRVKSSRAASLTARSVKSSRKSNHCDTPLRSGASSAASMTGDAETPRGYSTNRSCRLTGSPF